MKKLLVLLALAAMLTACNGQTYDYAERKIKQVTAEVFHANIISFADIIEIAYLPQNRFASILNAYRVLEASGFMTL